MADLLLGRGFARVCMIGGPLAVATAALLYAPLKANDHGERLQQASDHSALLVAAVNVIAVGLLLTAFAILQVVQILARANPVSARVFGFMLVAGMIFSHFFEGLDIALHGLAAATGPDVGVAVLEKSEEPFVVHFLIAPFYGLGALGLAVVAARSGPAPRWTGLLFAGWLLIPVGILSGLSPIAALGALGLLIAFWPYIKPGSDVATKT